jgi:hypothetical protein
MMLRPGMDKQFRPYEGRRENSYGLKKTEREGLLTQVPARVTDAARRVEFDEGRIHPERHGPK